MEVLFGELHWFDTTVVDVEFYVSKAKWCIIRCSTRVFARAKEELECKCDDVSDRLAIWCGVVMVCLVEDEYDNNDRQWFYTGGGGVFLAVAAKLMRDAEVHFAKGIFPDVRGPHLGKRLAHLMDGIFHCSRSVDVLHLSPAAISIPLCIYLDDGDGVVTVLEERVDVVREEEIFPTAPMCIH
jgi:hypothetical protein